MDGNELLTCSARELGRRIACREVGALEAVEAHIGRIEVVNPVLNAVVRDRFAAARAEAAACDGRLQRDGRDLPPLFGVPCTIKENFACTGMPQASGLVARRHRVASQDAPAVARLRAAGAIPLGVTNTSELCMWMESSNRLYGRTNNPYDPRRIVGGSSGGEGAVIGAGGSPFGVGADVGGSIRLPAFFNGVFGHKPTPGVVPNTGQVPLPEKGIGRYCVTGPLARRAEDLMPLLAILAGPDGEDPHCRPVVLGDPQAVRLDELEVVLVRDNGRIRVHPELTRALEAAATALAPRVRAVREQRIPLLKHGFEIWAAAMSAEDIPSFASLLGEGTAIPVGRELVRWLVRRSDHTLPALALAALEKIPLPRRYLALGAELRAELATLLSPRTVLLHPPYSCPAPRHHVPLLKTFHWVYAGIFNVMELPVTQVPLGLSDAGLPLGVQVVGAAGADHVTIAVALELERLFGGWVPPWRAQRRSSSTR